MDEQPQTEEPKTQEPLTDTQYVSYLSFLVGYLYAALVRIQSSGQISAIQEHAIAKDLDTIRPTLERVYAESFRRPSG